MYILIVIVFIFVIVTAMMLMLVRGVAIGKNRELEDELQIEALREILEEQKKKR